MNGEYARFCVHGVSLERSTGRCRLLLTDQNKAMTLSVEVEPHQAGEVILRANGCEPDSGDAFELFFRAHGFRLSYVQVSEPDNGEPRAEIHYRERARRFCLGLPLPQAVALAGRMSAPVYVHEAALPGWLGRESVRTPDSVRADILPLHAPLSTSG